jgi:hypothetical protein
MSNSEPTLLPSVPADYRPARTEVRRRPLLRDDIVVVCTTGLGVMALGGAALSIAHLLYLTAAPVSHYLDLAYPFSSGRASLQDSGLGWADLLGGCSRSARPRRFWFQC